MRKFLVLAIATLFASGLAIAAEVKTITGEGKCAKCALKETKSCQNVIEVDEAGTTVKYYLAKNKVSDAYHKEAGICTGHRQDQGHRRRRREGRQEGHHRHQDREGRLKPGTSRSPRAIRTRRAPSRPSVSFFR